MVTEQQIIDRLITVPGSDPRQGRWREGRRADRGARRDLYQTVGSKFLDADYAHATDTSQGSELTACTDCGRAGWYP